MQSLNSSPAVEIVPRPCPVCAGAATKHIFTQTFASIAGVTLIGGYDVVVCQACGAGYSVNIPAQTAFDAYYRNLSKYENEHRGGQDSEHDRARFRQIAEELRPFIPTPAARIVEVGCSTGGLLFALRAAGYLNVLGVDPSPACARTAWLLHGISVSTGTLFSMSAPDASSDFIVLVGVLEHVRDLDGGLAQIRRFLSPAGRVYLEVPDVERFASRPDAPFQEFSTEHINFFSETSLTNLVESRGFRKIACIHLSRTLDDRILYPVLCAVYEKSDSRSARLTRDLSTEAGLLRYIGESRLMDSRIRVIIRQALSRAPALVVWGAGAHTLRLLATGVLPQERIIAFVDSNPKYQGRQLCGIPIFSPLWLKNRTEPILISSLSFQSEIVRYARQILGLEGTLVLLYESASNQEAS